MRIAYLTCVYPPYPGGIGVAAQGMASEMARRGHSVEIFAPTLSRHPDPESNEGEGSRGFRDGRDSSASGLRMTGKVNIHKLQPWLRFGNAALLPQILWRLRDFDIIHMLYPFYGAAEFVPLLKRHSRAKIVVQHMMDAVASGVLGAFFRWHARHFMPRIFHAAHRVAVLSEDYWHNSEMEKLGLKNVDIIPNGVDIDLFRPAPFRHPEHSEGSPTNVGRAYARDSSGSALRMTEETPTILFVGGLDRAHYFKGVPVLLEACRILKDRGVTFQCQVVGEGEMRWEYEAQAEQVGLRQAQAINSLSPERSPVPEQARYGVDSAESKGHIQFLGLIPHDQLPAYFQQATVCVVPATERIECFSIVAAEAQACGIPAIVTDFPGVRVTIEDGVTGLVAAPGDAKDLADKIQELLENPEKAAKMGEAGRARVERMYSWRVVGDKLEHIYAGLRDK